MELRPLICVPLALSIACTSDAQDKITAQKGRSAKPEYIISYPHTFVAQVGVSGRLENVTAPSDNDFYPYVYGPQFLQVGPDGSTIYAGGTFAKSQDASVKATSGIEVYRLSREGRFHHLTTFGRRSDGYPFALAFGRQGRFVYVLATQNSPQGPLCVLRGYRVSKTSNTTKLLSFRGRIIFSTVSKDGKNFRADIASDPKGQYIYVAQPQVHTVLQYRITANGLLKPLKVPAVSLSKTPLNLVAPLQGPFFYVTSEADSSLTQLKIMPNGALQIAHVFEFSAVKRRAISTMIVTPNGRFLYVSDGIHPVIQQYAVQTDGALKSLAPPTAASAPESMTVDLTSRFLYLVDTDGSNQRTISPYKISSSGTLVRVKGNPTASYGEVSLTFAQPR